MAFFSGVEGPAFIDLISFRISGGQCKMSGMQRGGPLLVGGWAASARQANSILTTPSLPPNLRKHLPASVYFPATDFRARISTGNLSTREPASFRHHERIAFHPSRG